MASKPARNSNPPIHSTQPLSHHLPNRQNPRCNRLDVAILARNPGYIYISREWYAFAAHDPSHVISVTNQVEKPTNLGRRITPCLKPDRQFVNHYLSRTKYVRFQKRNQHDQPPSTAVQDHRSLTNNIMLLVTPPCDKTASVAMLRSSRLFGGVSWNPSKRNTPHNRAMIS